MNRNTTSLHKDSPRQRNSVPSNSRKLSRLSDTEKAFYIPLGQKLRSSRITASKKQTEVADALDVCMNHISDLENAYAKMTAMELFRFCQLVGTHPDDLLDYPITLKKNTDIENDPVLSEMIFLISHMSENKRKALMSIIRAIDDIKDYDAI